LTRKLLALIALAAPGVLAPAAHAADVKVMTRNLHLGADLIPLAVTPAGLEFQQAAGKLLDEVTATDPDARMKLAAAEIAKAKPDLVGLQEVSLWRTGPNPASTLKFDYTKTIMAELKKRHAHYRLAAIKQGFNVEAPTDRGVDVRLTLGDAILVRKGVKVSHVRSGLFKHQLTIPTQGVGPVVTSRGWNSLDARVGRNKFHFVNTHLEAYSTSVREAQAKELVKGPLKSKRPTILVGDLNSGPILENPDDRLAYRVISKAGFKPERTAKDSCCFGDANSPAGWDHNVDWIMAKPKVKLVRSSLIGLEKTASGQYPSDHGGVVSTLRLKKKN
jgi:endonuclease/exonuclease/phosphatase family metal-dependent hydrolase